MIKINYYYNENNVTCDRMKCITSVCDPHLIVIRNDNKVIARFKTPAELERYTVKELNQTFTINNHTIVTRFVNGKRRCREYYINDINFCETGPSYITYDEKGKVIQETYIFEMYGSRHMDLHLYSKKDIQNYLLLQ